MSDERLDRNLIGLRSPDPQTRVGALHAVCPCGHGGFPRYQQYMDEAHRLQKDPDSAVREAALHIQVDAIGLECIERRQDRTRERQTDLMVRKREQTRRARVVEKLRSQTLETPWL